MPEALITKVQTERMANAQRVVLPSGATTWTVLGSDLLPVKPVEQVLKYMRARRQSPNTVKAYARSLQLWWQYLDLYGLDWRAAQLEDFGRFLGWLRTGDTPAVASIAEREPRFAERTIALRLHAVASFYRFRHFNGVEIASRLYERVFTARGRYKPFLEYIARRNGSQRSLVAPRTAATTPPPTLTPAQVAAIKDACASWDSERREWAGRLRDRLLWALLEETGLRLGEALCLQHRDWHTGRGDTPFVEVVPRDHPRGLRVKGGAYRKLFISDRLDRLYGDHLWTLVKQGAGVAVGDIDRHWIFVNLYREPLFSPTRPETIAAQVRRLRKRLAGRVPASWTPHWFRHTHATALLLSGTALHVVSRRLGHADVQTTQNLYAWVTEDAELRAVADWRRFTEGWRLPTPDRARALARAAIRFRTSTRDLRRAGNLSWRNPVSNSLVRRVASGGASNAPQAIHG